MRAPGDGAMLVVRREVRHQHRLAAYDAARWRHLLREAWGHGEDALGAKRTARARGFDKRVKRDWLHLEAQHVCHAPAASGQWVAPDLAGDSSLGEGCPWIQIARHLIPALEAKCHALVLLTHARPHDEPRVGDGARHAE